ncbi:MAG: ABC transporter permease [Candidatus Thorarchaeota archaeon]
MSIQFTSRVIFKGIVRDLKSFFRYKGFLLGWLLETISMILGFLVIGGAYYFSPTVLNMSGLAEGSIFLFLISGTAVQMFAGISTWAPLMRVEDDIHFGTLEAIFVTPATRLGYLLSTTISRAIVSTIFFIPVYIVTLIVAGALTNFAIIGFTLLIALVTIISNIATGLFFGMLAMIFRQTRLLVSVLHQLIMFVCGAYLPVQGFLAINPIVGNILKYFAMSLPFTYCFDLMRSFLLPNNYIPLVPIWMGFVILFSLTIFYIILARLMLIPVERKAKKSGLSIL